MTPKKSILIAGDVTVDWLQVIQEKQVNFQDKKFNWNLYPGFKRFRRPGGAFLLADMIQESSGELIYSYPFSTFKETCPDETVHSLVILSRKPAQKGVKENTILRIDSFCGYSGPDTGFTSPSIQLDNDPLDVIILDDAGNGFRDVQEQWPGPVTDASSQSTFFLKMSNPLGEGLLYQTLIKNHRERLITICRLDDLRSFGLMISRRLSWERTLIDLVSEILYNPLAEELRKSKTLIIRIGIEAAVVIHNLPYGDRLKLSPDIIAYCWYDPLHIEGGLFEEYPGDMQGIGAAFLAGIYGHYHSDDDLSGSIPFGLISCRKLFESGYGSDPNHPDYQLKEMFHSTDKDVKKYARIDISPLFQNVNPTNRDIYPWTIIRNGGKIRQDILAADIVLKGIDKVPLSFPVLSMGSLKTIDRDEIESYQSIRNLLNEYLKTGSSKVPISIAVFGPPGSGKSFGVKQLAKSIGGDTIEDITFNLAQFTSLDDLTGAFHQVRDITLTGKLPLVFFDEFDSKFNGSLGWLKSFLAPMQDGKFREGERDHPIGRAIFVFAGGTSTTFQEFCTNNCSSSDENSNPDIADAKVSDFISRLRGYINIKGCNPMESTIDNLYPIRRAILFWTMIGQSADWLKQQDGAFNIDPGVIQAFLNVPLFRHGARSIQAIIDMSTLAGMKRFTQSCLPPKDQLELHTDAVKFMQIMEQNTLFSSFNEELAAFIHAEYQGHIKGKDPVPSLVSSKDWVDLAEEYKASNRGQAAAFPRYVSHLGYLIRVKYGGGEKLIQFSTEEVEIIAEMEHERWMGEKFDKGWIFGPVRDDVKKIHPDLLPWDQLNETGKNKDRNTVSKIPEFLDRIGFEVYRVE